MPKFTLIAVEVADTLAVSDTLACGAEYDRFVVDEIQILDKSTGSTIGIYYPQYFFFKEKEAIVVPEFQRAVAARAMALAQ